MAREFMKIISTWYPLLLAPKHEFSLQLQWKWKTFLQAYISGCWVHYHKDFMLDCRFILETCYPNITSFCEEDFKNLDNDVKTSR